jgi:rRNA-processing protein FCF1
MAEKYVSVAVVDTNVLLNLATPVIDSRSKAPSGEDPLKTLLASYDVYVPNSVLGEVTDAAGSDDLLSAAADLVLRAADNLTTHDVENEAEKPLEYGLDRGESEAIWLTNNHDVDFFVTDEFGSIKYLLVNLALEDRNKLFTTPHVLCTLAANDAIHPEYVEDVLNYYVETKSWDEKYVSLLRERYLR